MKNTILILSLAVLVLASTGACSLLPSSEAAAQSAEPYPIIDMHMHTYQWNKYGDPPQPNLITGNVPEARNDADALGAYVGASDAVSVEVLEDVVRETFGAKPKLIDINLDALHRGFEIGTGSAAAEV